jgi:hypothetical protein
MDSDETRNERCIKREKEGRGRGTRDAVRPFSFSDRGFQSFNFVSILYYSIRVVVLVVLEYEYYSYHLCIVFILKYYA